MIRPFTNGSIEYFIDQPRHIIFGRWEGDVRGDELLAASPELWRQYPEIGLWDAIHDMRAFIGMLEHRHTRELMQLRAELVPGFDMNVRTAVISRDPMKIFEMKVTKATAPDRQFRLFGGIADALAWMTADESGNPRAGMGRSSAPVPWWFDGKAAVNTVRMR